MTIISESLPETPEALAVARFGTTQDPFSAGWLLPDGTLLEMNRRHVCSFTEHTAVAALAFEPEWSPGFLALHPSTAAYRALEAGWISVVPDYQRKDLDFTMAAAPTSAQRYILRAMADQAMTIGVKLLEPWGAWRELLWVDLRPSSPAQLGSLLRQVDQLTAPLLAVG